MAFYVYIGFMETLERGRVALWRAESVPEYTLLTLGSMTDDRTRNHRKV